MVKTKMGGGKRRDNPPSYLRALYADVQVIKTDLAVIKEKLKVHEKLIYFILSILAAIFVKVVILS